MDRGCGSGGSFAPRGSTNVRCQPGRGEAGAAQMAQRYGRAKRVARLVAAVPHGHWKTTPLRGRAAPKQAELALRCRPADNAAIFRTYVERCLAPTLRPGNVVIMDNLSSHKVKGIAEAIEARGARLVYLPPYPPDRNPIEQAFNKLKALLRQAAQGSIEAFWGPIGRLLDRFTPDECRNYFENAGYASSQTENALGPCRRGSRVP